MSKSLRIPSIATLLLVTGLLGACGGGDGYTTVGASVTVSGTAATGAAIASGTVTLKCAGGSASVVTTSADGSFSTDASGVTFPCVGRVDYRDGAGAAHRLHTFVKAAGTANITTVTELLVAKLTGAAAANAFDNFNATSASGFTADRIKAAADAVKTYLHDVLGVDTGKLADDPIGTRFVAKSGSADGDSQDKVLDDVKSRLALAGKQLDDAETALQSGAAVVTTGAGCSASVATLFDIAKGSYPSTAAIFLDASDHSGTAAGFVDGGKYTVTVNADCTIDVGNHHFTYTAASYSESTDASGTQFDVDMASSGLRNAHFELFTNHKRGFGFSDPAKVSTVRLDQ